MRIFKAFFKKFDAPDVEQAIDYWIRSERDRKILRRRLIDGIVYSKIADEMDMSERQIKNIVSRTERELFKHMNE